METFTEDELNYLNGAGKKYFKPSELPPGGFVILDVVDIAKKKTDKFPVRNKDYTFEVRLADGSSWTTNNPGYAGVILRAGGGQIPLKPCRIRVAKKPSFKSGESQYLVEEAESSAI